MTKSPLLFGVFPYLCSGGRLRIRGVDFRSSDDLAELEPEIREHLETLCNLFYVGHDVQISEMTCCYIRLYDESHYHETIRHLYEIRLLLGYLYSTPTHTGDVLLPAESSTLFIFRPERVPSDLAMHTIAVGERARDLAKDRQKPEHGFLEGYEGLRNLTGNLWAAKGSHIYPEIPQQTLNLSQFITRNLREFLSHDANWAFRRLYLGEREHENSDDVRQRIFDGLEWYLRSCRRDLHESEALVHLAIGLESLLKVGSGNNLTERFKDAVLTLIGPVPRLDSWLEQFYTARSKAVHEGVPHELAFLTVDKEMAKKAKRGDKEVFPHRSLIEYGRRIFRLCLTNIVSAAENIAASGLEKLFVHNAERVQSVRKILAEKKLTPDKRLTKANGPVGDLVQFQNYMYEPNVEWDAVFQAARQLLKVFIETKPTLSDAAREAITQLTSDESVPKELSRQFLALEEIDAALGAIEGTRTGQHHVVTGFLNYATGSPFKLKCLYENNPRFRGGS